MSDDTHTAAPPDEIPPDAQPLPNGGNNVRASWQFSLSDVRTNMAHCNSEAKEVMISAFLWCIDEKHPVTRQEFAEGIKYDANTIYKIFTGKYRHPETSVRLDVPKNMLDRTRDWLALAKERAQGGKTEFVLTPTAKRIWTAFDLARESQSPVFITGPSHVGKTWASEAYLPLNNHGRTCYVRMKADIKEAVRAAGITKTVTPHTLRAAFATHALRCGNDIATVQELMGHESAETTLIYVGADGAKGVSPLDLGAGEMQAQRRALLAP